MESSILRGETMDNSGGLGIPDNQRRVLRDGDNAFAVGCEHAAGDGARMTIEHVHERA